jgi:hypothetical protein
VILWSICNEEAIQATPVGANIARTMQAAVKEFDPSRPVTAAVSGGVLGEGGIGDAVEVMGINYQLATHDEYHAKHPITPILAAETHCVLSTRGTYLTDPERKFFASYDDETAPWGATARDTWRHVSSRRFVAGMFAWTGFDYRGEPTPFDTLPSMIGFLLFAVLIGPAAGAFIGATVVTLHNSSARFGVVWQAWMLSNSLVGLTLLPLILIIYTRSLAWLTGDQRMWRYPYAPADTERDNLAAASDGP